jgi:rRNA maturation RNase YbeY
MAIVYTSIDISFPKIKRKELTAWIKNVIEENNKKTGNITFIFCSDKEILRLNKKYLKHNYYTDIITFDYSPSLILLSADLFISLETVKSNSEKFKTDYYEELYRVMIHGILHLCGYEDSMPENEKNMRELENKYLEIIKYFKND